MMISNTLKRMSQGFSTLSLTSLMGLMSLLAPIASHAKPYAADWLQNSSDLQADPAVTFGTLPNGMRYAIMHNETPKDAISLRLRIDAGSIQETDAQQGIAHLLEHMAFRGSKNIADGDVVKTLERLGLRFGADTNASTGFTETIYKFDMPRSDQASIDTGLKLLREIASELTLSNEALTTERGVVLSEFRLTDVAAMHSTKATFAAMLPDQPLAKRFPIGQADIVAQADAKLVRSYYEKFYQPQRATLVVVGNVDAKQIEAKIKAGFSSWQNTDTAGEGFNFGTPSKHATTFQSYAEAALPTSIMLAWVSPFDSNPPNIKRKAGESIADIGTAIINERLSKLALQNDAPFTVARAGSGDLERSAHVVSLNILTTPEKWQTALTATRSLLNTTLQTGVTQEEVDRAVSNILNQRRTEVEQAATRTTPALANNIVTSMGSNRVVLSPQYLNQLDANAIGNLKAETVNNALRTTFAGDSSMVFMSSSAPIDQPQLAAAYKASSTVTTNATQLVNDNNQAWPYSHFGAPGKIVSRVESSEQQATFVRYENGVVVGIKPTQFAQNEIQVVFKIDGGRLAMDKRSPVPSMLTQFLTAGGLKQLDVLALRNALTGRTISAKAGATDQQLILIGQTKAADLELQLQYLTAYLTEPGFQSAVFEQMRNGLGAMLPQLQAQPMANLGLQTAELLHNDPRWATIPTIEQLKDFKLDTLRAWLEPMLQSGGLQVNIVGDVDTEQAIQFASATVGALAKRAVPSTQVAPAGTLKFPAPTAQPVVFTHTGNADQSALAVAWPMPAWRGNKDEIPALRVLSAVMQNRLLKAIREESGQAYTANVALEGDNDIADFGYLLAISVVKPEQIDGLRDTLNNIAADLRDKTISTQELTEAVNPLAANMEQMLQNNAAVAANLTSTEIDTLRYEQFSQGAQQIRAVTAQQVQQLAAKYLLDKTQWQAVMQPSSNGGSVSH